MCFRCCILFLYKCPLKNPFQNTVPPFFFPSNTDPAQISLSRPNAKKLIFLHNVSFVFLNWQSQDYQVSTYLLLTKELGTRLDVVKDWPVLTLPPILDHNHKGWVLKIAKVPLQISFKHSKPFLALFVNFWPKTNLNQSRKADNFFCFTFFCNSSNRNHRTF